MAIQKDAPATFAFSFRRWDENGTDLGPLNLGDAEFEDVTIVLRKPGGDLITVETADITITDAAAGTAEWTAAAGQLDTEGSWKAQAWAGDWPSRVVGFPVLGPNLDD